MRPYVSVMTATYNRRDYLPLVFESLQRQTCTDFEWVVCDDGSTDATSDFIDSLRSRAHFEIRFLSNGANLGRHFAINYCAREARGRLVCTLDSDDQFMPGAVEWMKNTWESLSEDDRQRLCGIVAQKVVLHSGERMEPPHAIEGVECSFLDMPFRRGRWRENHKIIRADCFREFPFPEQYPGAFFPETVGKWFPMGRKYKARYYSHLTMRHNLQSISIQRPDHKGLARRQWPIAAIASRTLLEQYFDYFWCRPITFFNHAARYACYGALSGVPIWKQFRDLKHWGQRAVYLALLPVGTWWYLCERWYHRGEPKQGISQGSLELCKGRH